MSKADDLEATIRKRWEAILSWQSKPGRDTGKVYTYADFPQLVRRREFWSPWAAAWQRGDEDVTAITAQLANLHGAEEEARAINGDRPDGTHTIIAPRIPVPPLGSPEAAAQPAWDMAQDVGPLRAAEAVDEAAKATGLPAGRVFPAWAPYAAAAGVAVVLGALWRR